MKNLIAFLLLIALVIIGSYYAFKRFNVRRQWVELPEKAPEYPAGLKDGDIIFQISKSSQSKAIQLATDSKYSHCGIIYKKGKQFFVYEAIEPVKLTLFSDWVKRGEKKHYVIKRLNNADQVLNSETVARMVLYGKRFEGKHYDSYFEWSDDRIYCSELIWKIYKNTTGIEIGKLEKLKDFDLTDKVVKQKLKERYGNNIPTNETVISPASIFNSNLLVTVESN